MRRYMDTAIALGGTVYLESERGAPGCLQENAAPLVRSMMPGYSGAGASCLASV